MASNAYKMSLYDYKTYGHVYFGIVLGRRYHWHPPLHTSHFHSSPQCIDVTAAWRHVDLAYRRFRRWQEAPILLNNTAAPLPSSSSYHCPHHYYCHDCYHPPPAPSSSSSSSPAPPPPATSPRPSPPSSSSSQPAYSTTLTTDAASLVTVSPRTSTFKNTSAAAQAYTSSSKVVLTYAFISSACKYEYMSEVQQQVLLLNLPHGRDFESDKRRGVPCPPPQAYDT